MQRAVRTAIQHEAVQPDDDESEDTGRIAFTIGGFLVTLCGGDPVAYQVAKWELNLLDAMRVLKAKNIQNLQNAQAQLSERAFLAALNGAGDAANQIQRELERTTARLNLYLGYTESESTINKDDLLEHKLRSIGLIRNG